MRKRSTQEIIEVVGVYGNPDLLKKKEAEIAAQKKKDQDWANIYARYGGKSNYEAGRGLGT